MPDIRRLHAALVLSWDEDTGHLLYDELHPDRGQCATTALVVCQYLGGHIRRCNTESGRTHYWNVLPDGRELDLTRAQFDGMGDRPLREDGFDMTFEQVLVSYRTALKYRLLSLLVRHWLDVLEREGGNHED